MTKFHSKGVIMKYILIVLLLFSTVASSYQIGGAYARLVSCEWGQYGYKHGYIGTYSVNGRIVTIFSGSTYCKY